MSWFDIATLAGNIKYWYDTEMCGGIRWRAPHYFILPEGEHHDTHDEHAQFLPEVWSDDTIKTLGLMKALMILVTPNYPHTWRRGFNWWHRTCCYGCIKAKVMWPQAKKNLRHALIPFERDLPEMPPDQARDWIEKEIRDIGVAIRFKPLLSRTPRGFAEWERFR